MSKEREKAKLYQFAVLLHPVSEDETKKAPPSKVLVAPTCILAVGDDEAMIKASRAIPAEYEDRLEEVEIAVRPF